MAENRPKHALVAAKKPNKINPSPVVNGGEGPFPAIRLFEWL
jgi:hypothetical protein